MDGLRKRRAPGRPSRLNAEQLQLAAELYRSGPRTAGFQTDRWTTARFAGAIQARFGIRYDPDHVGRIIHRLGLRERVRSHRSRVDVIYSALSASVLGRAEAAPPA